MPNYLQMPQTMRIDVSMILPALIETSLFPLKMLYLPCHARIVLL